MNWADKRIMYLGAVIFALGAVVNFVVDFNENMGEPFPPLLFIPPKLFGPIVFAIGGTLFVMARGAIKRAKSKD